MKKIILLVICFIFFLGTTAQAKSIRVISLEDFSTASPSDIYKVQVLEREELKDGTIVEAGTIITGEVVKVKNASRGKRNGYFEFIPISYTYDKVTHKIENPRYYAKVVGYAPMDKKEIVESAARGAVGFFFKGASQGISFVQGVAQAEDGSRIKSGLVQMYKDSPLTYIEEGKELQVKPGDLIVLILKKIHN